MAVVEERILGKTTEGRPIVLNPDGSISTERTITIRDPRINNNSPSLIPSMFNGKTVTDREAIEIIAENNGFDPETGKPVPGFATFNDADNFAQFKTDNIENKVIPEEVLIKLENLRKNI